MIKAGQANNLCFRKPFVLVILDGWGVDYAGEANAISQAYKPNFDKISVKYPTTLLRASGKYVGLSDGQSGNSESGHLSLGTGRVLFKNSIRIDRSLGGNELNDSDVIKEILSIVKSNSGRRVHLLGSAPIGESALSSRYHLSLLMDFFSAQNVVFNVHLICADSSGRLDYWDNLSSLMSEIALKGGELSTLSGSDYGLDDSGHWEKTEKCNHILTGLSSAKVSNSEEIKNFFVNGGSPSKLEPVFLLEDGFIRNDDLVIFFNYKKDYSGQLIKSLVLPSFNKFSRWSYLSGLFFVSLVEVGNNLPVKVVFPYPQIKNSLGDVLVANGLRQVRIAETEKYAHVTYFFDGKRYLEGGDSLLVPSPIVASYKQKPEMSAIQITDEVVGFINDGVYDFLVVNFANPDMLAHTGDVEATVKAVEVVDRCLGKIIKNVLAKNGLAVVVGDHGNAERVMDIRIMSSDKEHTSNPVPFILVGNEYEGKNLGFEEAPNGDLSLLSPIGSLEDVAPTILKLLNIDKPEEMTGKSLF